MKKIKLPTPIWVQLYGDISSYVEEYGSIDNRFDDDGNRLEEYEDEFCTITDNVESIMEQFFEKSDDTGHKEIISSFKPVAQALQDYVQHELDIITESEWFDDLVANKVKQQLEQRNES